MNIGVFEPQMTQMDADFFFTGKAERRKRRTSRNGAGGKGRLDKTAALL
ncbi:MAG: hypothetical protein FWF84_02810 [Kiritimatiellaeota bacterium]|nr:hypothetical protein [Kiritimatiellota bacterium]